MANETYGCRYREITDDPIWGDDPTSGDNAGCSWFMSGCLFVIASPFVILAIIAFILKWNILKWIFLSIALLLCVFAIIERLSFCKLPKELNDSMKRPSPRLLEAERAKRFLGFDFGDDFKLRKTGCHDYVEILIDFSDESFAPLKEFCLGLQSSKTRKNEESMITIAETMPYIVVEDDSFIGKRIVKPGFTKIERYYDPRLTINDSLYITSELGLEVDYAVNTLKMFWAGW